MMDDRTGVKAAKVCGAFAYTFLLALLLSVQFDFYYDLNDDTMIKDIVSGAYTGQPSGYCIQMLYPLAWCIALFYRALPAVPWYGLFLCLCQFGVVFLIAVRFLYVMRSARTRFVALALEAFLVLGLFLREFVVVQYSVTSGICMAGALFLFLTAPKTDKPSVFFRRNLLPLLLVVLSFLIRTEVCIMLMPFLLLAGLVKWCGEDRFFTIMNFRKYITLIVTALLCMTAVYSIDMVAYRGSEWTNFRRFFDARTKLYDFYGIPGYEDNREFYESVGLSQESYMLLENYNFALDESIDTWRLESIVAYQEQLAGESGGLHDTFGFVSKNSVREALWKYRDQLQRGIPLAGAAVIVMYLLYGVLCIVPARGKQRAAGILKVLCILAVRSVLWMYLCMVDRVLDRVTTPLLVTELVMLVSFFICDFPERDNKGAFHKLKTLTGVLCIVGVLAMLVANQWKVKEEYDRRAAADARWNAMMDYCRKNGNNYYIIDVYSSTSYQGAPYSEKMFTDVDNSYKNFDICGGWAAKSPLARQKVERYHFRDIQSALCGGRTGGQARAYFVADVDKDLDWLVQYYAKRGVAVELQRTDQIWAGAGEPAFDVYGLVKK